MLKVSTFISLGFGPVRFYVVGLGLGVSSWARRAAVPAGALAACSEGALY